MGRWLIWSLFLVAWTTALVVPIPDPDGLPLGELIVSARYLVAKSIHVAGYGVLAAASAFLPAGRAWRWLLPCLLLAHGAATEWVQTNLSYRDGNLRDVAFNCAGVALGCLLTWRRWLRP